MSQITLTMETQAASNWCWAAVAASVGGYYHTGAWSQCEIADSLLRPGGSCCDPAHVGGGECNQPFSLTSALDYVGVRPTVSGMAIDPSMLQQDIDHERVICFRIAWDQGGAHFAVINGYWNLEHNGSVDRLVSVADPFFGTSVRTLNNFDRAYYQPGTWTHTYRT